MVKNMKTLLSLKPKILFFCLLLSVSTAYADSSIWKNSYDLEAEKKYNEAAELLLPKIQNSIKSEFAVLRYAWLNYLAADYNKAIENYKNAITYNPNSLDARLGIMLPLMAQNRWREATLYGEQVIAIAPWQYYAHIRVMACEAAQLMWSKLESHAKLVNERYPSDPDVLIYLARAQSNLRKTSDALTSYKKALEILPGNTEALQFIVNSLN